MEKLQPQFQITAKLPSFSFKRNLEAPKSQDTLPETNSEFTPENGRLEDDRGALFDGKLGPIFRGELLFNEPRGCICKNTLVTIARWWQLKYFLFSPPKLGKMKPILTNIFQVG